ncbi:MAG: hypothetical protein VXX61_00955 [Asgard group archaeon]|nr:hypothetical protein [Asgard group archaeon]
MIINNLLAFTIVTLFFFPAINKVVRLANRAWNEREFLEEARLRQMLYIVPGFTLIVFIFFYYLVLTLLGLIVI